MAAFLVLLAVHIVGGRVLQRRDYVTFRPAPVPEISLSAISPDDAIPVYATGKLSVEGSERRFTCAPGFYKTFATREHALLCQVRERSLQGVLHWPLDEVGMWYAFFNAGAIRNIEYGTLAFAPQPLHALAVEYEFPETNPRRFRRNSQETLRTETLYIACSRAEELHRILADLMVDDAAVTATAKRDVVA